MGETKVEVIRELALSEESYVELNRVQRDTNRRSHMGATCT